MKTRRRLRKKAYYGMQILLVGALTGLFAGLVVTLYNALATLCEEFSRGYYAFFRERPAFVPLLFLALFAGAVVIGGVVRALPVIRGSGIPQTEGAARGLLRFKWYQVLTGMFASSLLCIFMGLSAGAEGPSVQLGGACGAGVSDLLRRNAAMRKFEVTGGACAGLAVAFNAPLTGMAFAFEEAHKRFTPEVFACSFSSVIVALLVRNVLRPLLGLSVGAVFTTFSFPAGAFDLAFCGYALAASLVCALAGVGFYYLVFAARRLFKRLRFWKGMGRMLIPFALAGACGLITVNAMGGGHAFIEALGSGAREGVTLVFGAPLWATLVIATLLRVLVSAANMGAGVPCGVFVPMLAIGAGMGALLSLPLGQMGLDPAAGDALVFLCMAAFFATVVKAPITAIVMTVELTWSFTYLLPVVIGVAAGYLVGAIFRTAPIYERLLGELVEEERRSSPVRKVTRRLVVGEASLAEGRAVRDVLWPADTLIVSLERGKAHLVPDGETVLLAGDVLTAEGETANEEEFARALAAVTGGSAAAEGEAQQAHREDQENQEDQEIGEG